MRRQPAFRPLAAGTILAVVLLSLIAAPAEAHGTRAAGPAKGIAIAGLTHGQMAVMALYRGAVTALAEQQSRTDPTFRRLLNHGNLQYAYCLWGLMPGSLSDERSPFNECSHAYLATTKALLDYMKHMPATQGPAEELISRIDTDMVRSGASWVLCQFSGEAFSTGEIVVPRWRDILAHVPTLLTLLGAALVVVATGGFLFGPGFSRRAMHQRLRTGDVLAPHGKIPTGQSPFDGLRDG